MELFREKAIKLNHYAQLQSDLFYISPTEHSPPDVVLKKRKCKQVEADMGN